MEEWGVGGSDEKTPVITEWLTQCSRLKIPRIKEKVHTPVLFCFIHLKFIVLAKLYNFFSQFKCLCTEGYERKQKNESGAQQRGLEIWRGKEKKKAAAIQTAENVTE